MVIQLGYSKEEKEKVTKSFTVKHTYNNATFKEDTSILDPFIIITQMSDFAEVNYLYIPALKRYYYINDIIGLQGNRVALQCHCDVLMSFATDIKKCKAIIDKTQESGKSNTYLNDSSYINECKDVLQSYEFPSGFTSTDTIIITAGG